MFVPKLLFFPVTERMREPSMHGPDAASTGRGAGEMTGPLVGAAGMVMAADGTRGGTVAVVGTVTMAAW